MANTFIMLIPSNSTGLNCGEFATIRMGVLKEPGRTDHVIQNWMRNRNTVEFLGIWEQLNNPNFKPLEFEGFRRKAGLNSFVLTPKQWTSETNATGIKRLEAGDK